jgi:hypothetical protein
MAFGECRFWDDNGAWKRSLAIRMGLADIVGWRGV